MEGSSPARFPHRTSPIDPTLYADRRVRRSISVCPTDEKSLSDCAELADMARIQCTVCNLTG